MLFNLSINDLDLIKNNHYVTRLIATAVNNYVCNDRVHHMALYINTSICTQVCYFNIEHIKKNATAFHFK